MRQILLSNSQLNAWALYTQYYHYSIAFLSGNFNSIFKGNRLNLQDILYIFINFGIKSKKAGNTRRKLLAYPSFACIQTMLNGKIDLRNFL